MNIKKTILFIALLTPFFANGQIMIGPKAAVSLNRVVFQDEDFIPKANRSFPAENYSKDYKSSIAPGYSIGGALNYPITKVFSLHSELFYSYKGKFLKGGINGLNERAYYHFLELPLLIRLSYPQKNYTIYFNVGPNINYWLGGRGKINSDFMEMSAYPEVEYKEIIFGKKGDKPEVMYVQGSNRFQFGLDFGLGGLFPMRRGEYIMGEIRFTSMHSNFGKSASEATTRGTHQFYENLFARNKTLNFTVSYLIDINFKEFRKGKSTQHKK